MLSRHERSAGDTPALALRARGDAVRLLFVVLSSVTSVVSDESLEGDMTLPTSRKVTTRHGAFARKGRGAGGCRVWE